MGRHLPMATYALAAQAEHASLPLRRVGTVRCLSSFGKDGNDGQVWSRQWAQTCAQTDAPSRLSARAQPVLRCGEICVPAAAAAAASWWQSRGHTICCAHDAHVCSDPAEGSRADGAGSVGEGLAALPHLSCWGHVPEGEVSKLTPKP